MKTESAVLVDFFGMQDIFWIINESFDFDITDPTSYIQTTVPNILIDLYLCVAVMKKCFHHYAVFMSYVICKSFGY